MGSQLRRSEKMIENFVIERIESQLKMVRWGQNCIEVRDALCFESALFSVEGPYFIDKESIEEFLLHNGFAPKGKLSRKFGMKWEKWYFPVTTKNERFAEIRAQVEESYQAYVASIEEQSRQIIYDFAQSVFESSSYIVNDIQYKALEKMMGEYNRETLVFNNKRNATYQRPFIKCEHCDNCPVVVLVKNEDIDTVITIATDSFYRSFLNYFYGFITYANAETRYSNIKSRKACVYINETFIEQVKELFERVGINFSIFPRYEVSEYAVLSENLQDSPHNIPIFIELEELIVQDIIPNATEYIQKSINEEYKKFCNLINMRIKYLSN